jgi:hypothetical protein
MYASSTAPKGPGHSAPGPGGGLNARDNTAAMPPTDASVMTNIFCYADAKGTETIFGAYFWGEAVAGVVYTRLRIYSVNVTAGTPLVASITNAARGGDDRRDGYPRLPGRVDELHLGCRNDLPRVLHVSEHGWCFVLRAASMGRGFMVRPAITGVPAGTQGVQVHRNRLWFYGTVDATNAPKGLSAWYLPTGAIAGAVVEFNVGPFASKGGRIVAMRTWTQDGGLGGLDDLAVFYTDRGQAIVYQGTDPSAASTWSLVGVFDLAVPASPKPEGSSSAEIIVYVPTDCYAMKYGVDTLFLTSDGLTSAGRVLRPVGRVRNTRSPRRSEI